MNGLSDFTNKLRVLHGIDRHELEAAGALSAVIFDADEAWKTFRANPFRWMMQAHDDDARAVWQIVERRCAPRITPCAPVIIEYFEDGFIVIDTAR